MFRSLVNCKSLPVSSTGRPACLGSKRTTKLNHVESIFSTTATLSSKMSSSLIFEASFGVGFLTSPFQQKNFFHIEQWFAVNLPDGQTANREMDPILTACRLRSSQSIGQFYAKSGKWKLVFSHKNLAFKNLLAHLQQLRCATLWDGSTGRCPHPGKILWT